ncbi:MAG: hypothetical protein ACPIOQ_50850 [Promethearchaeia archaeon]
MVTCERALDADHGSTTGEAANARHVDALAMVQHRWCIWLGNGPNSADLARVDQILKVLQLKLRCCDALVHPLSTKLDQCTLPLQTLRREQRRILDPEARIDTARGASRQSAT